MNSKCMKVICLSVFVMSGVLHAMDVNRELRHFIQQGDKHRVVQCIASGADVNAAIERAPTLLMEAVLHGQEEICQLLLARGAKVNVTFGGRSALCLAMYNNHIDICKMLIEAGAGDLGLILRIAATEERYEICKLLIEKGADVNLKSLMGHSALYIVGSKGNIDLAKLIIRKMIWPTRDEINSLVVLIAGLKTVKATTLNQDMKRWIPRKIFNDIIQKNKPRAREQIEEIDNAVWREVLLQYLNTL